MPGIKAPQDKFPNDSTHILLETFFWHTLYLKCFLVKFPPGFEICLPPDLFRENIPFHFLQEAKGEFADLNGKYLLTKDQGAKPNPVCVDG